MKSKISKLSESQSLAFLLLVADGWDSRGARVPAEKIAEHRLSSARWPIYAGTKNRLALAPGSRVVIYVGGASSAVAQHVIAKGIIGEVRKPRRHEAVEGPDLLSDDPFIILELTQVEVLRPPIPIKPLLERLTILNPGPKWGAGLVGGCRRLTDADFHLLAGTSSRAA